MDYEHAVPDAEWLVLPGHPPVEVLDALAAEADRVLTNIRQVRRVAQYQGADAARRRVAFSVDSCRYG